MADNHEPIINRLPPEILAEVASHLRDDKSLIVATHVCEYWRRTLLSFPFLWSHLTFNNEQRALMFLERAKSTLVSIDLIDNRKPSKEVKERLKGIANRIAALRAVCAPFLDELLAQPLPTLKNLDLITSTFVTSLATTDLGSPLFPRLTNFRFILRNHPSRFKILPRLGDSLLDFLRNCPQLEVAFFDYGNLGDRDIEFTTVEEPEMAVSLPRLRSFAHESTIWKIHTGLFNRLSLSHGCDVAFTTTGVWCPCHPWGRGFPTLRGLSIREAKIAFHVPNAGSAVIRATFSNSKGTRISLITRGVLSIYSCLLPVVEEVLHFPRSSEMTRSIETLHLEHCPIPPLTTHARFIEPLLELYSLKTLVLSQMLPIYIQESPTLVALELVRGIAVSRHSYSIPLKTIALSVYGAEEFQRPFRELVDELRGFIELVEVESSV